MEQDRHENGVTENGAKRGGRMRGWVAAGVIAVLAVGGIGVAGAMGAGDGLGRHVMSAGFQYGGHFAGRGLGRVLDAVEATAEQEERIWAIIDGTRAELRPMMREFRDARGAVMEILGAETIDRAAVETMRAERMAAVDEASMALTSALVEAAEVLTPEQRASLVEHLQERGSHRRW
jgi:periplasmic protein CpxP/Spy